MEIQDPEIPTRPSGSWREDKPARDHGVGQQKQPPPSILKDQLLSTSLPSSLRRHYNTDEGDPPLEHRSRSLNTGEGDSQPLKMHGQLPPLEHRSRSLNTGEGDSQPLEMQGQLSHVDNKVSRVCSSISIHDSQPF